MGATLSMKGGKRGASALIGYVTRHGELERDRIYTHGVSAVNEYAQKQLEVTRQLFGKTGGIQAFHIVQSFDASFDKNKREDVQKAHDIGAHLVDKIAEHYPNHELFMGTHTDSKSGYIHNHIVLASLDTETGKKFHFDRNVGYALQDIHDELLQSMGIQQDKLVDKYRPIDYQLHEQGKRSNREQVKHMVLLAKQEATSFDDFKNTLKERFNVEVYEFGGGRRIGYNWEQETGEHFTIGARKLGSAFERPALEQEFVRSLEQSHALDTPPTQRNTVKEYQEQLQAKHGTVSKYAHLYDHLHENKPQTDPIDHHVNERPQVIESGMNEIKKIDSHVQQDKPKPTQDDRLESLQALTADVKKIEQTAKDILRDESVKKALQDYHKEQQRKESQQRKQAQQTRHRGHSYGGGYDLDDGGY